MGQLIPIDEEICYPTGEPFAGYPDDETREFCEAAIRRIDMLQATAVDVMIQIGQELERVKQRLPHGQYGPWLEAHYRDSLSSAHNCRRLARFAPRWPVVRQMSVQTAVEFTRCDDEERGMVLDAQAFTWTEFCGVRTRYAQKRWKDGVEKRIAEAPSREEALGDVVAWVGEALANEQLAPVAREVWQRHREEIARLSDRTPREMDAEVGFSHERPAGQSGQLRPNTEGFRVGKAGPDGEFLGWVDDVEEVIELWGGNGAGPKRVAYLTPDGPGSRAYLDAWVAAAKRGGLLLRTPADLAAEVGYLYGGEVL